MNNNPTKSQAIQRFLEINTHPDLASKYNFGMECQVLCAKDNGNQIKQGDDFHGREWIAWTNGEETWKSFRIPLNANTEPSYEDKPITFSLVNHAEGIGMTGWDWQNRMSCWVAYDFDAIAGHSERHSKKLTDDELANIVKILEDIPFVTLRKSTSGRGLHLYVFLEPVRTSNHNEHAALARAILSQLSGLTGHDFMSSVDICGGNMWVWHRKMRGTDGLKLIKEGCKLTEIPTNWRDHVPVTTRKTRRSLPQFVYELNTNDPDKLFLELCGERTRVGLDCEHRALIDHLSKNGAMWWWDQENYMLVTHTFHLKEAKEQLGLRGIFETLATGTERGADYNCFCFPLRGGAWTVRRYSLGAKEADGWEQDGKGWTRCFFNRSPDLSTVARLHNGVESAKGGFIFREAESAQSALMRLGLTMDLPLPMLSHPTKVKPVKGENKIVVSVKKGEHDNAALMSKTWYEESGHWNRVFRANLPHNPEADNDMNYDDFVRHVVTSDDTDSGWVIKSGGCWIDEPLVHVQKALAALEHSGNEINSIVGNCVMKSWKLVNKPFQPEYTGDREWNRFAAQLAIAPSTDLDNLSYPNWLKVLRHCGKGLDEAIEKHEWCKSNGITCGADYLKLWIACLFKHPTEPLPYLAFYGQAQDSGKSTFHEAIAEILILRGYKKADLALTSQSAFNGELRHAILCAVEEVNLGKDKTANNRMKDWVTAPTIQIHQKMLTPFSVPNTTHWVQTCNEPEFIPVFAGDTRITMVHVAALDPSEKIPKRDFMKLLRKEAPDFLASVLNMEIPDSRDRLMLPVVTTQAKINQEGRTISLLEQFIKEECYSIPGAAVPSSEFYTKFQLWLEERDRAYWTKQRTGRELPEKFPKGRLTNNQAQHYGNISFESDTPASTRLVQDGLFLKQEGHNGKPHENSRVRPSEEHG